MTYITDLDAFFLLDHFSGHPWGCVEALKPFLGPFFPRKLLINMLVTLIGENSASESTAPAPYDEAGSRSRGQFSAPYIPQDGASLAASCRRGAVCSYVQAQPPPSTSQRTPKPYGL